MSSVPPARDGRSILVIDDNHDFRERLAQAFTARGLIVTTAASQEAAISAAERDSPELALVDLRLGSDSGLNVIKALKHIDATTNIVVLTGYGSIATAVESIRLGATTYLTKPANADQILAAFDGVTPETAQVHAIPSLARVEWEHIQHVLMECEGNVSLAARRLGLHRRSLQRKLSKDPGP